jgi:cell wall-associated NlpC family hydrolase
MFSAIRRARADVGTHHRTHRSRLLFGLSAAAIAAACVVVPNVSAANAATKKDCSWAKTGTDREQAACFALNERGKPYVSGAEGPNSFDCSGLVQYVFNKTHLNNMPRTTYSQWDLYKQEKWYRIGSKKDLQVGDLVFFDKLGHVGIYVGGGDVVHAPYPGKTVRVESMSSVGSYYGALHLKS